MKLTDTTANALTTTSFLGAATAAAVQYNELVKFIGGLIAIFSGLAAFVYYLYKIYQLKQKMKEIKERIFSKLENDYFRRERVNSWVCIGMV
jgi:hypothetical protein